MNELIEKIENLRGILCSLIENRELTDIEVVLCSHVLDKFLIQYEKRNEFKVAS